MADGDRPASSASDRAEIMELVFRLARAMDARDWPLLESCYTAEAVGRFATGEVVGVTRIKGQYEAFLTPLDVTQHLVTNVACALSGDTATVHSYFHAQHVRVGTEGGEHFVIGGQYDDEMVRTPSGWRIGARQVRGMWSQGNPRVVGGTLNPSQGE